MFKRGMDSQGQISVEYLLLLVVIFVVFGFMITKLIGPSIDASNDISGVSAASNTVNSIANAANIVYANGPGSKRTLNFYIPQSGTKLVTSGNTVSINVTLSNNSTKVVNATTNVGLGTATRTLSQGNHVITFWWDNINTKISTSVV